MFISMIMFYQSTLLIIEMYGKKNHCFFNLYFLYISLVYDNLAK